VTETGQARGEAAGVAGDDLMLDPDAQRYETALRTLLGAVEAMENGPQPGDHA
jgi:hypothetical protein